MAAVPSIGRASRVERRVAPAVDVATQLYDRYSAQLYGYCLHQLGSREEAEDAVQTTFMNAFRGLARGIVPDVEQAWLYKIAHNVCLSRRRSSWRRGRVEAPNNMEVLQEVVPAKEKVADELIRLQDVLEEMPESQRRAILLREWQGLSYREISDELNLSQAAVETLIFRARRALAAGLEKSRGFRRGADVGGVLGFVKAMVGGGGAAAVKVGAVIAVAGAAVATTAVEHARPHHRAQAKRVVPAVAHQKAVPVGAAPAASTSMPVVPHHARAPHQAGATKSVASAVAPAEPGPAAPAEAPRGPIEAPPAPAPPATTPPSTAEVQAQPVVHDQPAAPAAAPKGRGHDRPTQSAPPAAAGKGNPHDGKGKGQPEPTPPAADPATDVATPGNSGDHGDNGASAQDDKADKGGRGNGQGK